MMSRFHQRVEAALRNPEVAAGYAEAHAERAQRGARKRPGGQAMAEKQGKTRRTAAPGTFAAAALAVLGAAREPLTVEQITDEALRRGHLRTTGKTPRRTMAACLYTLVKEHPDAPIERLFTPGISRAQRGSVRWRLRASPAQGAANHC